ncbi:hypothetical protein KZ483_18125 [Paenibacillus sp. sptzw28]|uniref:hypothetical protein n=1 Tax=Paenibacillus sp. sptzw28 TaxID=715179 RepID=UPI001C6F3E1A|nr:hypothetical protein [Paenibacillus sp. sptzw28]QYR19789.1 hypothetical protein KZ483_18125 [Paenibacillus sp. sptzw28]
MTRAVSADQVMFGECIEVFRLEESSYLDVQSNSEIKGYLLLDFDLRTELKLSKFKIHPTKKVNLFPTHYQSFISPVTLFDCKVQRRYHLYIIALSSLFSFVSSRPTKAPRDDEAIFLTGDESIAMLFPQRVAGPGGVKTSLPDEKIQGFASELEEVVEILYELPYETYKRFMQSIRLIQLAHNNKRDDFSLAYYLLVSAIEGVAQMAIPIEIKVDPQEEQWEKLAKEHKAVKSLLGQFTSFQKNSHQLTKRFTKFILEYCPISEWHGLEHHFQDMPSYGDTQTGPNWITKKKWFEVYPNDFKDKDIKTIIEDTYNIRSKYSHEGEATPHTSPETFEHFFERVSIRDKEKGFEKYLINYRLLSFIAKTSILKYMRTLREQLRP